MVWFRCFIRGDNFPGQMVGETRPVGFYVTRFVKASNITKAESIALKQLRAEPMLAKPEGFTPSDNIRVFFEEIEEVKPSDVPEVKPGYTWYPMDEENR